MKSFCAALPVLTVTLICVLSIQDSEIFGQPTELELEAAFVNRLANKLIQTNRPIEYALALDSVQVRLELNDVKRRVLNQIFDDAETAIAQSRDEYLSSLSKLKTDFELKLCSELDAVAIDRMRTLLHRDDSKQDNAPSGEEKFTDILSFRHIRPQNDQYLIPIVGQTTRLATIDQWWLSNLTAKQSVKLAEQHLRYSITNQLSLNDRFVFSALSLSESQWDDLNRSLNEADGMDINVVRQSGSEYRLAPSIEYQMIKNLRILERANKRDHVFRTWARQNLTQSQIDTLWSLYLQSFERTCSSTSAWCLIDLVVDLSQDQIKLVNNLRNDFLETEQNLWHLHVDRCRSQLSKSHQIALKSLDSLELTEFNRLLRLLRDKRSGSEFNGIVEILESMSKKSK